MIGLCGTTGEDGLFGFLHYHIDFLRFSVDAAVADYDGGGGDDDLVMLLKTIYCDGDDVAVASPALA